MFLQSSCFYVKLKFLLAVYQIEIICQHVALIWNDEFESLLCTYYMRHPIRQSSWLTGTLALLLFGLFACAFVPFECIFIFGLNALKCMFCIIPNPETPCCESNSDNTCTSLFYVVMHVYIYICMLIGRQGSAWPSRRHWATMGREDTYNKGIILYKKKKIAHDSVLIPDKVSVKKDYF